MVLTLASIIIVWNLTHSLNCTLKWSLFLQEKERQKWDALNKKIEQENERKQKIEEERRKKQEEMKRWEAAFLICICHWLILVLFSESELSVNANQLKSEFCPL